MKWETKFSRHNLIIGLIEKGLIRKKIMFYVLQVYDLPFFTIINKLNISYKPYLIQHQLFCSPIWLPESNKSDRNRTGDSMGRLASLHSIPPTFRSFVCLFLFVCFFFSFKLFIFSTCYTAKFTFISFLSCRNLWA